VPRVRVVEADDLQALVPERDHGVPVAEHLDAAALEGVADLVGAGPVIVVAEHGEHRRLERSHHLRELIEVGLAVADEVAGDEHHVRALGVGHLDRGLLHLDRRDPPDVLIGDVGDAEVRHLIAVDGRAGETAEVDPVPAGIGRGTRGGVRSTGGHTRGPRRRLVDAGGRRAIRSGGGGRC